MIHSMPPRVLASNKQGILEQKILRLQNGIRQASWKNHWNYLIHCNIKGWEYILEDDGKHKITDQVVDMLKKAVQLSSNIHLNSGPLPTGELQPEDLKTLKEAGRRIRKQSWDNLMTQ